MHRRRYLAGLGVAGAIAVAGCYGSAEDRSDGEQNGSTNDSAGSPGEGSDGGGSESDDRDDEPADQEGATNDQDGESDDTTEERGGQAEDPADAVEEWVDAVAADGHETALEYTHSQSTYVAPLEDGDDLAHVDVSLPSRVNDPTLDQLRDVGNAAETYRDGTLAEIHESSRTAIVVGSQTLDGQGGSDLVRSVEWIVATEDGEWRVLTSGEVRNAGWAPLVEEPVIDHVALEESDDAATVTFVEAPPVDAVSVAADSGDETSVEDPSETDRARVDLDAAGDAVTVTATVGDESERLHREQYPPGDRAVADVEIVEGPNARIDFRDPPEGHRLDVETRRYGAYLGFDTPSAADLATVQVASDADEVVVTLQHTEGSSVLHCERYHGDA